jgi:nitrite reductase (NO-forming)
MVNITLTAEEGVQEIAPGIKYHVWTFNGTTPAPVIRVHLGDTIHFTLINASTIGMQHSIDFHAAMTPWADLPSAGATTLQGNYQPVDPGHSKTFDWVAMFPGVFMYHCGVQPVLEHLANGLYGAIIVEPPNLPKEREFVLVSSEFYPGPKPIDGLYEGDLDRMLAVDPQYVVFNGKADQYKTTPLQVRPNEPFRLWVVNAGPTLTNAFHVIGTMFDETHPSGNLANTLYGLQTWGIQPGDGAMFELNIPDPGLYPFVTHAFAYTGLGAVGLIEVTPDAPAAPNSYPLMADPFSAGVKAAAAPQGQGGTSSPAPSVTPSPSSPGGTVACAPTGTTLHLTAHNAAFDTDCLAAPAGAPFTVVFNNLDPGIPHNFSIYMDSTASEALFTGALVTGPNKMTYQVKALKAGTYYFRCDVHPTTMFGTFVVK